MTKSRETGAALMSTGEVARMLAVDPKTVARYARTGMLLSVRTPGGHLRFFTAEVTALRAGLPAREARKAANTARDLYTEIFRNDDDDGNDGGDDGGDDDENAGGDDLRELLAEVITDVERAVPMWKANGKTGAWRERAGLPS